MRSTSDHDHPIRRRATRVTATLTLAAVLLAATACHSGDAVTTTVATTPPTTIPRATDPAPPTPTSTSTTQTTGTPTTGTPTTGTDAPASSAAPPTSPDADPATTAMLHDILESHRAAGEFVGARIALLDRDGTITEATDGTTSIDPDSGPVDPDVPWNIGSVTKTFVAVVVLQLAEEGRLDLDAGIDAFVPDLPGADRITARQLLQHTSGLGEYIDDPTVRADLHRSWTPAELIAVAEAAGRVGEPGGGFHYANTNYIVLGEIIERITGRSWSDEVHNRIAEPLGMTHTGLVGAEPPVGYVVVDGAMVDVTVIADPSIGGAAGGLQSTGRDLLRFATAVTDGTLLTAGSQAEMQRFIPGEDYSQFGIEHGYGLGLERYSNPTIAVIGHMGTGEAQSAFLGYDPIGRTAVAVMTNTAVPGPQAIMAVETLTAAGTTR